MTDAIVKWLNRVNAQKKPEGGGAKNWWRWPLLIIIVLLGLAIGVYILNRNNRELAKLRHERNKAEIEKENKLTESLAEKELDKARAALIQINEIERRIQTIDEKLVAAEAKHAKDVEAVERMRWSDLSRGDK